MTDMEPILPEDRAIWQLDRLLSLSGHLDRASLLRELVETAKALTGSREGKVVVEEAGVEGSVLADPDSSPPQSPFFSEMGGGSEQRLPLSTQDNFLEVPIMLEGEELGSLVVWDRGEGGEYSQEERKRAELLAAQAGVALGFIRLKEEREKWLERMVELDSQKSSFIAIASHELRTPLGLILGYSTYLREVLKKAEEGSPGDSYRQDSRGQLASAPNGADIADTPRTRKGTSGDLRSPRLNAASANGSKLPSYGEELDTIISSAMRLKEIVDSLAGSDNVERGLALVRGGEVPLREVVKEALEGIREEAGRKRIRLKSEFGKGSLTVEGDRGKVATALGNLVHNAVTYTEKGGHVTVRVEMVSSSTEGSVRVTVIDDGIGIPAKDLEHIFERFYQVEGHMNRKHGGLGLGLSLARENVELHGGRIWAESEEGKGSRFCFELPVRSTTQLGKDLAQKARGLLEG
jgi:signal transduction histidine kinase